MLDVTGACGADFDVDFTGKSKTSPVACGSRQPGSGAAKPRCVLRFPRGGVKAAEWPWAPLVLEGHVCNAQSRHDDVEPALSVLGRTVAAPPPSRHEVVGLLIVAVQQNSGGEAAIDV